MVAESGRNLEDKSLSIGKSFKYSIPSRVIFQPRTRLPIYKKWTMGPIYLQVKSLQLDHFPSKSTPISFGFANKNLSFHFCVWMWRPSMGPPWGWFGQIYLRSGKYLHKHVVKQCKEEIKCKFKPISWYYSSYFVNIWYWEKWKYWENWEDWKYWEYWEY